MRERVDHVTPLRNTHTLKKKSRLHSTHITWWWGHSRIPHFNAWNRPPFECRSETRKDVLHVWKSKVDMSLSANVRVQNQREPRRLDPFWHIRSEFKAIKNTVKLIPHTLVWWIQLKKWLKEIVLIP